LRRSTGVYKTQQGLCAPSPPLSGLTPFYPADDSFCTTQPSPPPADLRPLDLSLPKETTHRAHEIVGTTPFAKGALKIEDKFMCYVCNKSYVYLGSLDRHMKSHQAAFTNARKRASIAPDFDVAFFQTQICNRQYSKQKELEDHVYEYNRLFPCSKCRRSFVTLERMLIHDAKCQSSSCRKTFECELCGIRYSEKISYQLHVENQNLLRYKCPYCLRRFPCLLLSRKHKTEKKCIIINQFANINEETLFRVNEQQNLPCKAMEDFLVVPAEKFKIIEGNNC